MTSDAVLRLVDPLNASAVRRGATSKRTLTALHQLPSVRISAPSQRNLVLAAGVDDSDIPYALKAKETISENGDISAEFRVYEACVQLSNSEGTTAMVCKRELTGCGAEG